MALTIRMRIDDNDEHQYYYATGSGTEIELIPLVVDSNGDYVPDEGKAYNRVTVNVPSTELETLIVNTNGTYNAPDGKAYNVVQVDVQSIINLQNKSQTYRSNGSYTIQADSGYDGLGTVSVAVNVPTPTPELQFKSELYTSNGTYNVRPDSGYDGLDGVDIEVNVPATPTPSIQASKSQTITQNGTVTVSPDSGYDAMEEAEITVNVPTGGNVQNFKQVTYNQNGYYQVTPDSGYDGIATVGIGIEVPTGGGGGDVLTGTVTVADGENLLPITIPSGKTIKEALMFLTDYSDLANITLRRAMGFDGFVVSGNGAYKFYGYKNSATDTAMNQNDIVYDTDTTPPLSTFHPLGVDTTGQLKYRGKSVDSGYSFIAGYSYTYLVVLE